MLVVVKMGLEVRAVEETRCIIEVYVKVGDSPILFFAYVYEQSQVLHGIYG